MWAKRFLEDLLDPTKTPRVPKAIRGQARSILRHYPSDYHLRTVAAVSPEVFQERMEPVQRLIMVYEQGKENES